MRRICVLSAVFVVLLVASSCKDDGRTLREPKNPNSGASISTTSTLDADDPSFDTLSPDVIDQTFPPIEANDLVTAPWEDGAVIDARYTCEGLNVAPALSWTEAPLGTAEIAITFEDLDAPTFVHWIIAGISPDTTSLAEGEVPIGAYEATNGLGDIGYTGPCPPAGEEHLYLVTVHFLGTPTGLSNGVPGEELFVAVANAEAAFAEVTGIFSRNGG